MEQMEFDRPNTFQTFEEIIHNRRSIRRYQARPIEKRILNKILDAALWAPSAHNRQPWRFCVITSHDAKANLSAAMGDQWQRDLSSDGADPEFVERRVAISRARMMGAAALVMVSLSMEAMDTYPDAARNQAEWTMAVQSTALACQNLLLATHAEGLGACWMCAPLFVPDLVRRVLDLPATWHPQALITLGYPAEEKTKDREPVESKVVWR